MWIQVANVPLDCDSKKKKRSMTQLCWVSNRWPSNWLELSKVASFFLKDDMVGTPKHVAYILSISILGFQVSRYVNFCNNQIAAIRYDTTGTRSLRLYDFSWGILPTPPRGHWGRWLRLSHYRRWWEDIRPSSLGCLYKSWQFIANFQHQRGFDGFWRIFVYQPNDIFLNLWK